MIKVYKDVLIVFLSGDIDQHKVSNIRSEIDNSISNNKTKHLIFDFSKVDFMDSSGIGMVLSRYKAQNSVGGLLKICGASENTMKLFDMVGMKKVIDIYNSLDECLLSF